jgi:ABC-type multidrug transport system fused ATPase/permease subunit
MEIKTLPKPDRILNYWAQEKLTVFLIVVFGLSFNISMVLGPIWQGKLLDGLAAGAEASKVLKTALTFLLLILAIQTLRYFKRFYIRRFANRTSARMRLSIYRSILGKKAGELDAESPGNLMTRAVADVDLCVEGMRKFTTEIFDTGVLMASYLVSLFLYDVKITLVAVAFIPVAMLLAQKLKTVVYSYTMDWRKKSGAAAELAYENIENALLYRVRGLEGRAADRYRQSLLELQSAAVKAEVLENSLQPIYNAIAMVGVVAVIWMGGNKALSQAWTIGAFSAYMTIFVAFAFKASKASKLFNSVQKAQISWRRIKPYLSASPEEEALAAAAPAPRIAGGREEAPLLSLRGLRFNYGAAREPILRDLSLEGRRGEIIGVTGPVACGKSSLGLALTGIYPYAGSALLAGRELRDYPAAERSLLVTYAGHNPQLFSDTISRNVSLGRDGDLLGALRDAGLELDLRAMPLGAETPVGNAGYRLSGGQQARVGLARALFLRRALIVLDDPFSAVDVKTEAEILSALRAHYAESLIVLISHRLTAFPDTDRVVLISQDGSASVGTHSELMESSGLYSEIYRLQSSAGREGE